MFSFRSRSIILAAALLGCAVAGCEWLNPAARLYGKWKLDVDATIDRNAGGNDVQAGLARAAWGVFGGDLVIEFRSDGTGTFTGESIVGGSTEEGRWSVVRAEPERIEIEFTSDRTGNTRQIELNMPDADTFEVEGAGGNVAIFRRVKKQ